MWSSITTVLLTAQKAPRNRKMLKNIKKWQMLHLFHSLRTTQKCISVGMSEQERPMGWIAAYEAHQNKFSCHERFYPA